MLQDFTDFIVSLFKTFGQFLHTYLFNRTFVEVQDWGGYVNIHLCSTIIYCK